MTAEISFDGKRPFDQQDSGENLIPLLFFTGAIFILISSVVMASRRRPDPEWTGKVESTEKTTSDKEEEEQPPQKLLSMEQIDLVAKRQWKEILAWIVFSPEELCHLDRTGQSILHHACLFRAPAEIIQMILWQAPQLAAVSNPDGEVPLHWAVRLSAPNEHIHDLLAACPESGTWARDKDGNTPLTLLWDRHHETILETWWTQRDNGIHSLHAWKRIMLFFPCGQQPQQQPLSQLQKVGKGGTTRPASTTTAAAIASFETPLHVASRSPCPPGFFPLLIQVFRADVVRPDQRGRLPLHWACSNARSNRSTDVRSKVQALLQSCSKADRRNASAHKDAQGRTPFYTALEAGIGWEEGLKELVACQPQLIMHGRDPLTRLDPFLLAATAERRAAVASQSNPFLSQARVLQESSRTLLNNIYTILRMDPSPIAIR